MVTKCSSGVSPACRSAGLTPIVSANLRALAVLLTTRWRFAPEGVEVVLPGRELPEPRVAHLLPISSVPPRLPTANRQLDWSPDIDGMREVRDIGSLGIRHTLGCESRTKAMVVVPLELHPDAGHRGPIGADDPTLQHGRSRRFVTVTARAGSIRKQDRRSQWCYEIAPQS